MVSRAHGDLLIADVEALVNTVNTKGIMGKGVALQFKRAFPDNFRAYRNACNRDEVQLGKMFVHESHASGKRRIIVNFPTKGHWRAKSRLSDIEAGLADLRRVIVELGIRSIAVPPLGCGNGGLDWRDVEPLILDALGGLENVRVLVYPPEGAPPASEQLVRTPRPSMTAGRAALLGLIARYSEPGDGAGKLEIQKLLYFLQEAGEPLKLDFVRAPYGPYADATNHALERIEGHFVVGYGDGSRVETIRLLPGAEAEAETFLEHSPGTLERFTRVADLIRGFETPYGLELLATTHWVTVEFPDAVDDPEFAASLVTAWNSRKGQLFGPDHVSRAWQRLRDEGWLHVPAHA